MTKQWEIKITTMTDSDEESNRGDKKDDDSDDGVDDENIDIKVDGNTWGEILKKTLCAISALTEETEIDGKWFPIVYKVKPVVKLFKVKVNKKFLEDEIGKAKF